MSEKNVLNEIILAYRRGLHQRYTHDNLHKNYEIPPSFTKKRIELFRNYFLNYVYPHPDQREELNDAFQSLDNYIKHPEKLLRIIIDSSSLIFKYGRHLPKILKAGIKALKSFRAATHFEHILLQKALSESIEPPFDQADMDIFLSALSRQDIDDFIVNNQALFETLYDRTLVKKITNIVEELIKKMKKRPTVYSAAEVKGLEIGRDIIVTGNALFDQLSKGEQRQILDVTIEIERDVLYKILSKK